MAIITRMRLNPLSRLLRLIAFPSVQVTGEDLQLEGALHLQDPGGSGRIRVQVDPRQVLRVLPRLHHLEGDVHRADAIEIQDVTEIRGEIRARGAQAVDRLSVRVQAHDLRGVSGGQIRRAEVLLVGRPGGNVGEVWKFEKAHRREDEGALPRGSLREGRIAVVLAAAYAENPIHEDGEVPPWGSLASVGAHPQTVVYQDVVQQDGP